MTRWLLTASIILLLSDSALALELQAVLERTMVSPPARVEFREERHNALFDEPLQLTGFLEYLEGGELRKVVETPFEEAFHVLGDRVEIERDGETQSLPVSKSRALQTMLAGIEAILAGQVGQIEKVFTIDLSGSEADWSLRLTPRSRRIAKQLHSLVVAGDDRGVTSFRFDLSGSEWHQMDLLREPAIQ